MTFNHPDAERRPDHRHSIEGVQVRLVDPEGNEAAACTRARSGQRPECDEGVLELPDATDQAIKDGWFSTGDIAVVDADGYYYVVDLKKDLIIRGGYNVYPERSRGTLPASLRCRGCGHRHSPRVTGRGSRRGGGSEGRRVGRTGGAAAIVKGRTRIKNPRRTGPWTVANGPTGKLLRREVKTIIVRGGMAHRGS